MPTRFEVRASMCLSRLATLGRVRHPVTHNYNTFAEAEFTAGATQQSVRSMHNGDMLASSTDSAMPN